MTTSATEMPGSEEEFLAMLSEDDDLSDIEDLEDDAATLEDDGDPTPADEEGDDPTPPEGDAEALEEGLEDDAAEEVAEEVEPEELAGEPEPEPEAEVDPEAEPAQTDGQDPGSELQWEPWVARADKQEIQIPGAQVSEAGVFIPRESLPKLQEHLTDRSAIYRQINQLQAQLRTKSGAEAEAETIVAYYKGLMEDPDAAYQFFQNFEQNRDAMLAKAEAAREKQRADSLAERQTQYDETERETRFLQEVPDRVQRAVSKALSFDEYKDLGLDAGEVAKAVQQLGVERLFLRADSDFELAPGQLVRKGEIVLNSRAVLEAVEVEARVARARREAAAATEAAKRRNASKSGSKGKKPPPAVQATGAPPAKARRVGEQPKSLGDWEDELFKDDE